MSPQRKLLSSEDDICKPLNEDNPDPNDLCVRIKEVMATIEEVTKQINEGNINETTLDTLTDQSKKLQEVVNKVEKNPELIDDYQINKEEMKKKTEDVKKEVESALDTVTDKIDGPGSNVAVIVVGVIGGLIVVMLVAAGGYIGYRKHQQRQKRPKKMMNYDMLEEVGQNNPAFQMDRQPSASSHQPQPGPPPSQPSQAPRPASIPSRGVPVLPRVSSRPPSSYGEETGYISDSASRPSYMGSRASHTSHNTDRSSYPPSSSRPKGLRRIDP